MKGGEQLDYSIKVSTHPSAASFFKLKNCITTVVRKRKVTGRERKNYES